jgi:spoIIIJ-associated protein
MVKIEAESLELAYSQAAQKLSCSITQLNVEVIQAPSKGFLGLFKKQAIIVATAQVDVAEDEKKPQTQKVSKPTPKAKVQKDSSKEPTAHNDIILPESFVTDQEDDYDGSDLYEDEDQEIYVGEETEICEQSHDEIHEQLARGSKGNSAAVDNFFNDDQNESYVANPADVAEEIKAQIDQLFSHACFELDEIHVSAHDDTTILVEFTGKDAALLIGKEGYRYKALSYMLYNWINAKYQLQLRLEIAEFLKNQEEMICKYLEGVYEHIDRDGRAQTKILDGVLVQIALRELRASYPDKYVAIRSTRDGAKFIIINSFNNDNY